MNTAKIYYNTEGDERTIYQMIKEEPHWAANRLQEGERAIAKTETLAQEIDHLKFLVRSVVDSLPQNKDWLDPAVEKAMKNAIK